MCTGPGADIGRLGTIVTSFNRPGPAVTGPAGCGTCRPGVSGCSAHYSSLYLTYSTLYLTKTTVLLTTNCSTSPHYFCTSSLPQLLHPRARTKFHLKPDVNYSPAPCEEAGSGAVWVGRDSGLVYFLLVPAKRGKTDRSTPSKM